jgi:hypothetical protein
MCEIVQFSIGGLKYKGTMENSRLNTDVSNSSEWNKEFLKFLLKKRFSEIEKETDFSSKKRKRGRKRSHCESNKRFKHSSGRSTWIIGEGGAGSVGASRSSDIGDTFENSTVGGCTHLSSSETVLPSRSLLPKRYNFCVELDPKLDSTQRIELLQEKIQELRKTYKIVKAELASFNRRRRELRQRKCEKKSREQNVVCS